MAQATGINREFKPISIGGGLRQQSAAKSLKTTASFAGRNFLKIANDFS